MAKEEPHMLTRRHKDPQSENDARAVPCERRSGMVNGASTKSFELAQTTVAKVQHLTFIIFPPHSRPVRNTEPFYLQHH